MSKNILFFISSFNGGAENQLYRLFELLKDENEARYVVAKAENSNSNVIGLNKKKTIFAIPGLIKEIIKLCQSSSISLIPPVWGALGCCYVPRLRSCAGIISSQCLGNIDVDKMLGPKKCEDRA